MSPDVVEVVTESNDLYGKLRVPTQSAGATIDQGSVEMGPVESSGGSIKEERYEDHITRLTVTDEQIEIGLALSNHAPGTKTRAKRGEEPDRTLRVPISEVTDVRKKKLAGHPGFVFETTSDVYEVKLATTGGGLLSSPKKFDEAPIEKVVEVIEAEKSNSVESSDSDSESGTTLTDELERLADLHEKGALSDTEFQQAKDDLLN